MVNSQVHLNKSEGSALPVIRLEIVNGRMSYFNCREVVSQFSCIFLCKIKTPNFSRNMPPISALKILKRTGFGMDWRAAYNKTPLCLWGLVMCDVVKVFFLFEINLFYTF